MGLWKNKTKAIVDPTYTSNTTMSPTDMQQWIQTMQQYQMPKYNEPPEPVDQFVYVVNKYDIANDMNFDVAVFTSVEFAEAFIERQSHDGFDWDWQEFILDKEVIDEEPKTMADEETVKFTNDPNATYMWPITNGNISTTYYTGTSSS